MRRIFKLTTLLTTLLAGTVLASSPAQAIAPVTETFRDEGTFDIQCGKGKDKFVLVEDFVADVTEITYFDQEGNPDRAAIHVHFVGVITNPDGETFSDPGALTIFVDLEQGTEAYVGLVYNITLPGGGSVVQDTGKVVFDAKGNVTFEAGPHEFLEGGDELLCAALG